MSQTGWYSPRVGSRKVRSSRSAKLNSKFETSLVYIILWVDPQNEILYTFYFWYKAFSTVVNSLLAADVSLEEAHSLWSVRAVATVVQFISLACTL